MKNQIVLFLTLPLVLAACASVPEYPTAEEARMAITEKITMANDRWSSGDPMGFIEVAASDITWMDDLMAPVPVKGKEQLTAYLENFDGQIPPHRKELLNMDFQNYGDMVVVTYHYQGYLEEVTMNPWKVSSVYRFQDGDWLSVHENWTKVDLPSEEQESPSEE